MGTQNLFFIPRSRKTSISVWFALWLATWRFAISSASVVRSVALWHLARSAGNSTSNAVLRTLSTSFTKSLDRSDISRSKFKIFSYFLISFCLMWIILSQNQEERDFWIHLRILSYTADSPHIYCYGSRSISLLVDCDEHCSSHLATLIKITSFLFWL